MDTQLVILGGSGVKDSPLLEKAEWKQMHTLIPGANDGIVEYQQVGNIAFIPRHGRMHQYSPGIAPYRSYIVAAATLGAKAIIATSAVGSLRDDIPVESIVIPDDYIDETGRDDDLYGHGFIVHAASRPAFSEPLRAVLTSQLGDTFSHSQPHGRYVCIPGPRFGTRAEGERRRAYADIVGMTVCPEAALAMQAGLHYAVAAFVVDMDHDANHDGATRAIMARLSDRVPAYMQRVVGEACTRIDEFGPRPQLKGNIIDSGGPHKPQSLQRLAERIKKEYLQPEL